MKYLPCLGEAMMKMYPAHCEQQVLGTLSLLGIVIIGNFGQVFFLLGITDEKCH